MQMIKPNGSTRPPIKAAIAVACGIGLLLCAGVGSAEAAKISRDHRTPTSGPASNPGGVKVIPRAGGSISAQTIARRKTIRCSGGHWTGGLPPVATTAPSTSRRWRARLRSGPTPHRVRAELTRASRIALGQVAGHRK